MWVEKSKISSEGYNRGALPPRHYEFECKYRIGRFKRLSPELRLRAKIDYAHSMGKHYLRLEALGYPQKWEEARLEPKKFGISFAGIKVRKEEIFIDPTKLEQNVFYLFSYKDEKYVARKSDKDVVEIYEVIG